VTNAPPVPDEEVRELQNKFDNATEEERKAFLRLLYAESAKEFSPLGFAHFYDLIFDNPLPKHAKHWVDELFRAIEEGKQGVVIEAFRGSTKTTDLTIGFTAYFIGHHPTTANLLIQVGDDIAQDNTQAIAGIIANNAGWKMVFPHIVPDRDKGWGAGGYEVKRDDLDYSVWTRMCAKRKDPTMVGVGYKSREIIGKHPDGLLLVDDIHDENNTISERELANVRRILTGTIFPTRTKDTWGTIFVGTPWVANDVLQTVKSTGNYIAVSTPVFVVDPNGKDEFEGQKVRYTWKSRYGEKECNAIKRDVGTIQFSRMYLLDLTAASNKVFKYMTYPSSEIRSHWATGGGADYAGTMDAYKNKEGKLDYFALAYVAKLPGGGAVVVDGVLSQCTQGEAEDFMNRAQEIYPMWQGSVVEGDGKGEDFIQVIRRNPDLRIVPMKTGGKGKHQRLVLQMSPWLENGTVKISDAETPYLLELRRELDNYPLNDKDDAMDALYWALRGMPDVLVMKDPGEGLPGTTWKKKKTANPFLAFGGR